MRTLNIRGALIFAVVFLALAYGGSAYFPSDTSVHFSAESGFYDEPVTLEMTCEVPGAEIYYTLDGSVPTERSRLYTEPLMLHDVQGESNLLSAYEDISTYVNYIPQDSMVKANVIRAVAFFPGGGRSTIQNGTFFIDVDRETEYGNVPIVSLFMEEDDLFDYEYGIYTMGLSFDEWYDKWESDDYLWYEPHANYRNSGREWERNVHVEILPGDSNSGFSQNMGIRIKGGYTRTFNQKSFRLFAREEYGAKNVAYALFPDNVRADGRGYVETYKTFTLRSGGNDCYDAKIRDPLIQNLAQGLRFDTQSNQPCVVFLNGEYWGLYTLTEDYGDQYIEKSYGIDAENVVIYELFWITTGVEDDASLFHTMYSFITQNDMSLPENYRIASTMLDMGNFADYYALQFYVRNTDGPAANFNNFKMWRARTLDSSNPYGDGRWRMMLFDVDISASLHYDDPDAQSDNLSYALFGQDELPEGHIINLIRSLIQNADFRQELVNSLCDIRNHFFGPKQFEYEFNRMRAVYEPLMPANHYRFGPQSVVDWGAEQYCEKSLNALRHYFEKRWEHFPQIMKNVLGLSEPAEAAISVSGDGSIMVNHCVPVLQSSYTGQYFPDCPITLSALETGKGRFVRWEVEGCTLSDSFSPVTVLSFEGDFKACAVFE